MEKRKEKSIDIKVEPWCELQEPRLVRAALFDITPGKAGGRWVAWLLPSVGVHNYPSTAVKNKHRHIWKSNAWWWQVVSWSCTGDGFSICVCLRGRNSRIMPELSVRLQVIAEPQTQAGKRHDLHWLSKLPEGVCVILNEFKRIHAVWQWPWNRNMSFVTVPGYTYMHSDAQHTHSYKQ